MWVNHIKCFPCSAYMVMILILLCNCHVIFHFHACMRLLHPEIYRPSEQKNPPLFSFSFYFFIFIMVKDQFLLKILFLSKTAFRITLDSNIHWLRKGLIAFETHALSLPMQCFKENEDSCSCKHTTHVSVYWDFLLMP